eukprot:c54036_g1_i1 orf=2-184(+)
MLIVSITSRMVYAHVENIGDTYQWNKPICCYLLQAFPQSIVTISIICHEALGRGPRLAVF